MNAIACTCFLLLCDKTILPFSPKSKSESQNFEVSWKTKFRLSWKVSWISFKWVEFQNVKSLARLHTESGGSCMVSIRSVQTHTAQRPVAQGYRTFKWYVWLEVSSSVSAQQLRLWQKTKTWPQDCLHQDQNFDLKQGRPSPKSHDATFPLHFLPLPPLLPFLPFLSPFFLFFPFPFPSLPSHSLPFPSVRSRTPSNPVRESGGALWAASAGSGAEHQPKSNLVYFILKIWHLVETILNFVPPNFLIFVPRGFLWRILRRQGCLWTPLISRSRPRPRLTVSRPRLKQRCFKNTTLFSRTTSLDHPKCTSPAIKNASRLLQKISVKHELCNPQIPEKTTQDAKSQTWLVVKVLISKSGWWMFMNSSGFWRACQAAVSLHSLRRSPSTWGRTCRRTTELESTVTVSGF